MPMRDRLLITEPIQGVDATQPITRIIDVERRCETRSGRTDVGGYEQNLCSTY